MSDDAQTTDASAPALRRRDFEPLRHAERQLLAACMRGEIAKIGFVRPVDASAGNRVRASFIAFLARGGADPRRAPRRIQLIGAWIEGRLDLSGASIVSSLWFYRCAFDAAPMFDQARLAGSLAFPGCALPGLHAEGCRIAGDLLLNAGCSTSAEVELSRAVVRGRVDASRASLCADLPGVAVPLRAVGLRVAGDLLIGDGLVANGTLQLTDARIGGDLRAGLARLGGLADDGGGRGDALDLERAWIGGDLRLDAGFSVAGRLRLRRVRVDGDLDASGAALDLVGDAAWGGAAVLQLDRARIAGTLRLTRLQTPLRGVSLVGARAGALADDALTWGDRLALDGFSYARFADDAPVDADFRIGWLMRQRSAHLQADFRPAPWRRLVRVLRRGGHDAAAREVSIRAEMLRGRSGGVGRGLPAPLQVFARAGHRVWGVVAGYGHRPGRLVGWIAALWLVSGLLYWEAAGQGAITAARGAPGRAFEPLVYSLDQLLPGIDLRQRRDWQPLAAGNCMDGNERGCWGAVAWWTGVAEALLGWAGCLALALMLARARQRDR